MCAVSAPTSTLSSIDWRGQGHDTAVGLVTFGEGENL